MGSRVRIRLFHLHFETDFLFPLLKNSESSIDDRGHRFRSGSSLTNYPHAAAHFLYSAMGELVCNGQLWATAALGQLRSYKVG